MLKRSNRKLTVPLALAGVALRSIHSKMSSSMMTTELLKVDPNDIKFSKSSTQPEIPENSDTLKNLNKAVSALRETSNPIAFPTETVYGLGGSALSTPSVKGIYAAKNRPADNPLIVHVSSVDQLERKLLFGGSIPEIYKPLIEKFWPGPLTILLPVPENTNISPSCTVGQSTFAVRMPSNPVARSLIALSDIPLAAPSANASTKPSPTRASHVYHDLQGKIPLILDGGPCDVGVESTVVDGLVDPPMLLRPGGVSLEEIKKVGGEKWSGIQVAKSTASENEKVKTPGMKYKHYSPRAPVALFINSGSGEEKVLDFLRGFEPAPHRVAVLTSKHFDQTSVTNIIKEYTKQEDITVLSLGSTGSDISRNLFAMLREVDDQGMDLIIVEGIDETDEGLAVMNRLKKAASTIIN